MNAMEKMIAQMIGISPEQMSEMVKGFHDLLTGLTKRLEIIEAQQLAILAKLNEGESDDR